MLLLLTLTLTAVAVAVAAVAEMTVILQRLTADCCGPCCNADADAVNAELLSRRYCGTRPRAQVAVVLLLLLHRSRWSHAVAEAASCTAVTVAGADAAPQAQAHIAEYESAPRTVCMSLMLVADVAVAHARSAVAESCPRR